ncbi:DnaJ domain-containing protein [bacterium]|nr:DnaJ domain-containing protein [bacterium]MBU1153917.1 DnaJ domain-containing protein [bacterium]MBU1781891.1 DnaJ domain-containing protein [bacterium]
MKFLGVILILGTILYILSPVDIIPDFFIGVGWLDDIAILITALWLFKKKFGRWPSLNDIFRTYRDFAKKRGEKKRGEYKNKSEDYYQKETNKTQYKDPYAILEVSKNASKEEIKAAYRRLASQYHPDKVESLGEELKKLAHEKMLEIQWAYDKIMKN